MRLLNNWSGLRLSTISASYHISFFLAGLTIDRSFMPDFVLSGKTYVAASDLSVHFWSCVIVHGIMVILECLKTLFVTRGRYMNMKTLQFESPNVYLLIGLYTEVV